jgi:hypothetical protein
MAAVRSKPARHFGASGVTRQLDCASGEKAARYELEFKKRTTDATVNRL